MSARPLALLRKPLEVLPLADAPRPPLALRLRAFLHAGGSFCGGGGCVGVGVGVGLGVGGGTGVIVEAPPASAFFPPGMPEVSGATAVSRTGVVSEGTAVAVRSACVAGGSAVDGEDTAPPRPPAVVVLGCRVSATATAPALRSPRMARRSAMSTPATTPLPWRRGAGGMATFPAAGCTVLGVTPQHRDRAWRSEQKRPKATCVETARAPGDRPRPGHPSASSPFDRSAPTAEVQVRAEG